MSVGRRGPRSAAWLEIGHVYRFIVKAKREGGRRRYHTGILEWRGQTELEASELVMDFSLLPPR